MGLARPAVVAACALALICAAPANADVFEPVAPTELESVVGGNPCAPTGTETVSTDETNYPNFGTVQITGSGYLPACQVVVRVTRPDGSIVRGDGTETPGSDVVDTDANGGLAFTYQLTDVSGSYLVEILGEGDVVLAQTSFWDAAVVSTLRLGGVENYVFTSGDTIQASGTVAETTGSQSRWYRWFVRNPSGTAVASTSCTPSGNNPSGSTFAVSDTYTVQPGDPISTGSSWNYRLVEYTNNACTGSGSSTADEPFRVAAASTFSDAGGATQRFIFAPPGPAFVRVLGVEDDGDWDVTWLLPSGAAACSNTTGSDRPDSDDGLLPETGAPLQYPPNLTATGDAWNRQANYSSASCPAMSSANEGTWKLRVQDDSTHFVTMPAFIVDATAPDTSITEQPPNPSNDASPAFRFTGTDTVSAAGDLTFECKIDTGPFTACTSPWTQVLSDGSHTFQVRAIDQAGNVDPTPASFTWVIDTEAPDTSIDDQPPNPSNDATPAFEFSGTDNHSAPSALDFECSVDAGAWADCESPSELTTPLGDGEHTFAVRAIDEAGNTDSSPDTYTWVVDTVAPGAPTIDDGPDDLTNSTSATFEFTGAETGDAFECKLDTGDWQDCDSPVSYTGLADGDHTFHVRQVDAAGNEGAEAMDSWTIDTVEPETTIDEMPPNPSNDIDVEFEFSGTDDHSAPEDLTFECKLDEGDWYACDSPDQVNDLTEGSHTYYVRATDGAGNTDSSPASYEWFTDLTAPDTTIVPPSPNASTNSTEAEFNFTGEDNHTAEEDLTFECKVDDGAWHDCESPKTYTDITEGAHTFAVRATDEAGNTDQLEAVLHWYVDLTDPDTSIDETPDDPSGDGSPRFEFSGTDDHSPGTALTFECKLDEGSFEACDSPKDFTDLADGEHTFYVRATDEAGNSDETPTSFTWVIDTVKPESEADAPTTTNDTAETFAVTYHATDDRSGVVKVQLYASKDGGPYALENTDNSPTEDGSFAFEHDGDGTYRFYTIATDAAGNVELEPRDPDTLTIVEDAKTLRDTVAPVVTLLTPPANTNDPTPEVSGTAGIQAAQNDAAADDDHVTVEILNSSSTVIQTKPNVTVAPDGSFTVDADPLGDGDYTARASQSDGAGNSDSDTRAFTVDTVAPAAPNIDTGPDDPTNDTSPEFTFTAAESGGTLECKLDSGAYEECESPQSYSGLGEGGHTFSVRQVDAAGNESPADTHSWYVDLTDPDTTIDERPDDPTSDSSPRFEFSGSDDHSAEGDLAFECSLDSAAYAPCTSPEDLSGLSDGSHTFAVRAIDEAGNTDGSPASYTFVVDTDGPAAPSIDEAPDGPTNSSSATFEFTGAEAGETFECKLDSGDFEDCDSPTTYNGLADGSHSFSVRQVDAAGNEGDLATFLWLVDLGAPDTTIDERPDDPSDDASPRFEFSGTDNHTAPGDLEFECKLDGGAYADCDSPKDLSGLSDGSHTFSVRSTDEAGNTDGSPASYTWVVDTAAPAAPSITAPPEGSLHNTSSITLQGTAENGADIEVFEGATSRGTTTANGSGAWSLPLSGVTDGSHTYTAKATDAAGNTSDASAGRTIVVDTAKPQSQASSPASSSTNNITVTYTASDNPGGTGLDKVELWAKGPSAVAYTLAGTDSTPNDTQSFAYTATGDGAYSFYTLAYDRAGNAEDAPASPDSTTTVTTAPTVPPVSFSGFFKPLDNPPVVNEAKAGSTIPVKFSLGGNRGMSIFADGYPKSQSVLCNTTALVDGVEQTSSPGASGLTYDAATQTYQFNWKTEKGWTGCRQLVLKFLDGTYARANMKFK